jgi:Carboxypeptidase regulatory-like domain
MAIAQMSDRSRRRREAGSIGCWALLTFFVPAFVFAQGIPSTTDSSYEDHNQVDPKPLRMNFAAGFARDKQGFPIPHVRIFVFTEKDHRLIASAESDQQGMFRFNRLEPGTYRMVAKYDGLCPANVPIRISALTLPHHEIILNMRVRGIDDCSYGAFK